MFRTRRSTKQALAGAALILPLAACSGTQGEPVLSAVDTVSTTVTVTQTITPEVRARQTTTETITVTQTVGNALPTNTFDPSSKFYDGAQLAEGISAILTQPPPVGYGLSGVSDVACPPDEPIAVGTEFQCSLLIDGTPKTLTIKVKSDEGLYQVYPPEQ